jgi:hypothetical protein
MKKFCIGFLCAALALLSTAAHAQNMARVRGTITAVDGNVLSVTSRDGKDLKLQLTDKTTVSYPKAIKLSEIKLGDYVGTAATPDSTGRLVAREVHLFPETARGTAEGHFPWDSGPGSTMTNANLAKMVKATDGQELTLDYKGGSKSVLVPEGIPIVTTVPGDRSLLRPGARVFISAELGADGSMTAARIQATRDGVDPPQ